MVGWLDTRINRQRRRRGGHHHDPVAVSTTVAVAVIDVQGAVLAVISERTGYPEELIELDLDLEADLSVDSIKRAEVAGEVANKLGLSVEGDEAELEDLVKARTVRAMVGWLDARINAPAAVAYRGQPLPLRRRRAEPPEIEAPARVGHRPAAAGLAPRTRVAGRRTGADLAGARFLITGGGATGVRLAELLAEAGASGVSGSTADDPTGVDGIMLLDGLGEDGGPLLPDAFGFLKQALAAGPRWLIAAGPAAGGARTDGMTGLFRTIAREYPETVARYVEVIATASDDRRRAWSRNCTRPPPRRSCTGGPDGRHWSGSSPRPGWACSPTGVPDRPATARPRRRRSGWTPDSVVVLIGGARGITPWFARTVADAARCRIELVGRTPLPQTDEDPELAAAADKAALRTALARRGMRSPADIDRTASAILAAREVGATVAELTELGAHVRYHCAGRPRRRGDPPADQADPRRATAGSTAWSTRPGSSRTS